MFQLFLNSPNERFYVRSDSTTKLQKGTSNLKCIIEKVLLGGARAKVEARLGETDM